VKIVVVVADATHAVHVGGEVIRVARSFDAPPELAEFVLAQMKGHGGYNSVSLAIDSEEPTP
jgi:hypothetical protein